MRTHPLLTILFAAACVGENTMAEDSPVSVTVAIPAHNGERRVEHKDHAANFHVIVSNTSDKPERIWREWCSWGYYGLSFELTGENGEKRAAQKKPQSWTRNFPDWWTLDPHESLVIDVHFGDLDAWQGFPLPENGSQTLTMQAIFEFEPDDEARKHGVWTGCVTSKPEKFTFYHRTPNLSGQEARLDSLSKIPDLRDLSLKMTEAQLKSHVEKHGLYSRKETQADRVTYWLLTTEGENVYVGFASGKCTGIQRMQPIPKQRIVDQIGASEYQSWTTRRKAEPAVPLPPPVSSAPENIDPATGLPWGAVERLDPITGLPERSANEILTQQMADILRECESMKPGMTREDLLRFFTTEGGLSTQKWRTFVNNRCPYIKIDVGFALTESKEERPTDVITKITKPYLSWSIGD